ncbi:Tfp pilus assembly protein FimT/FimU [Fretibacter rubidus]|uniref:pilus assembly FimT family protein n=1 Tax=Fretibacter rubidus TaxID=570162 RepID=UPI00352A4258
MPISPVHKSNQNAKQCRAKSAADAGFSILEIIIVLTIMGIMLSLVGARMMTSLEATRFARTVDAAMADIRLIRADAMLSKQPRYIVTDSSIRSLDEATPTAHIKALSVPPDWRVMGNTITISPSGVCAGGRFRIIAPDGRRADYVIAPPKCEATRLTLDAG